MPTTWRMELDDAMRRVGDPGPVEAYSPDEATFDVEFDNSHGGSEGPDALAWTPQRVYFPVVYAGAEWMESAPRNPGSSPSGQHHVGGE